MAKRAGQRRNPNSPRVKTRRMRMSFCDLEFDRTWNCKSRYRRVSRRSSVWMRPCVLRSGRSSVCRWQPHIVSISLLQTGAHGPKLLLCSTAAEVPRQDPPRLEPAKAKHSAFNTSASTSTNALSLSSARPFVTLWFSLNLEPGSLGKFGVYNGISHRLCTSIHLRTIHQSPRVSNTGYLCRATLNSASLGAVWTCRRLQNDTGMVPSCCYLPLLAADSFVWGSN